MPQQSILDEAPKEIADGVALVDGKLICSEAYRGTIALTDFISVVKRETGADFVFVPVDDFARDYADQNASALAKLAKDSDVQNEAKKLLADARRLEASDIHMFDYGSYGIIKVRRKGMLMDFAKKSGDRIQQLIRVLYDTKSSSTSTTSYVPYAFQDSRIVSTSGFLPPDVSSIRFHNNPVECADTSKTGKGNHTAMRLLYDMIKATGTLEQRLGKLGYDSRDIPKFDTILDRKGLTIIAGPTGHGKSTLLKQIMDYLATSNPYKLYLSIEDPPEFPLEGVAQILVNTNVDSSSDPVQRSREYVNAIAAILRSDPDGVMIGELRYNEAVAGALESAQSGHATYATLHASGGFEIISRLETMLAATGERYPLEHLCERNVLNGLVFQNLAPELCPKCKIPLLGIKSEEDKNHRDSVLPQKVYDHLMNIKDFPAANVCIRGRGCSECDGLGIIGQKVAAEVIVLDETLLRLCKKRDYDGAYKYWLNELKGRTYIDHAREGVLAGLLDPYQTEQRINASLDAKNGLDSVR